MPAGLQSRGGVEEINVLGKNLIREEGKARRSAEARWTEATGLEKKPASRCARRDRVAGGWVRRRDLGRGARHEIAGNSRTDGNQRSRTRLGAAAARSRVASTPNGAPGGVPKPCLGPVEGGKTRASPNRSAGIAQIRTGSGRERRVSDSAGGSRRARGAHSPSC